MISDDLKRFSALTETQKEIFLKHIYYYLNDDTLNEAFEEAENMK